MGTEIQYIGLKRGKPYADATKTGNLLFISGQVSQRREDGSKPPFSDQAKDALRSLKTLLEENGSALDKLVKCNVYLSDKKFFGEMNKEYMEYIGEHLPARLCIYGVDLYDDLDVEIDAIAIAD